MSCSDPIADMLTIIRNGLLANKRTVAIIHSMIKTGIAQVLKDEGFIDDFDAIDDGKQGSIRVKLRYTINGEKVIHEIKRVSKSGCRVYSGVEGLPSILEGMGISIVSTSKGVMSDRKAREANVGGELLCQVS